MNTRTIKKDVRDRARATGAPQGWRLIFLKDRELAARLRTPRARIMISGTALALWAYRA